MARLPRLAVGGLPHLVQQRAAPGRRCFVDDLDRLRYLEALGAVLRDAGIALHAYALMDDHVHLLLTPPSGAALGSAMQRLGRRYVAALNARHGTRGSPWAGRFRAAVIEPEAWLLDAIRHIEANPLRHGRVAAAHEYRWSSAAHHAGLRRDTLIAEHPLFWRLGNTPFEREAAWRALEQRPLDPGRAEAIRAAAAKGWALGSAAFLAELAQLTPRRLAPARRGRRALRAGGQSSTPSPIE